MHIYPAGRGDVGGGVTGGGDLSIPPPEHSRIFHCNKSHCGTVYGGVDASGVMGVKVVVIAVRLGLGGDAEGGSRGGKGGGMGEGGRDGDEDMQLIRCDAPQGEAQIDRPETVERE